MRVFISHGRGDGVFARFLTERLSADGLEVSSAQSVRIGENFADVLSDEIRHADSVVVLMSPDYFASRWCQSELATALSEQKLVLPVHMRGDVSGPLSYLNALKGADGPEEVAHEIAAALEISP